MANEYQIDLDEIEDSLRLVQKNWDKINSTLLMRREVLDDTIIYNILAGYEYVNTLLAKGINPLDRYELNHYLELNHIVLCGDDPKKRKDFEEHIKFTTERFYKAEKFSISHMRKWAEKHSKDTAWLQAAGIYIMGVSQPQLFFEGNHRTGCLLMGYILVKNGKPPFVLTVDNAKAYFDPSTVAKQTNKDVYGKLYKLPKIKKNFAEFLKANANTELVRKRKKKKK